MAVVATSGYTGEAISFIHSFMMLLSLPHTRYFDTDYENPTNQSIACDRVMVEFITDDEAFLLLGGRNHWELLDNRPLQDGS